MNFVLNLILTLLRVVLSTIVAVEEGLRAFLAGAGLDVQVQNIAMIVVAAMLIVAAYRLLGGIFGFLITLYLALLVVHILAPGMMANLQHI